MVNEVEQGLQSSERPPRAGEPWKGSSFGRAKAPVVAVLALMWGASWSMQLVGESSAGAQQRDPRELEAKTACLAGRSDRGIELLAQLYAETNDPTYIYNQARCFEQNGKSREAVTRFREYLRKSPNIAADERAQVQARITELEAQEQEATPAPPSAPPARTAGPVAPSPGLEQPSVSAISTAGAPGNDGGRSLRVAGVAAAGLGVLGVVTGIYMHSRAVALSREVTDQAQQTDPTHPAKFDASKYDDGRRAETLQWVSYSVGATALLAGGVLYLLGMNQQTPSDHVTVMALPSLDGGFSTSVRLRF